MRSIVSLRQGGRLGVDAGGAVMRDDGVIVTGEFEEMGADGVEAMAWLGMTVLLGGRRVGRS